MRENKQNKLQFKGYMVIDDRAAAWSYVEPIYFKDKKEFLITQQELLKNTVSNKDTVWEDEESAQKRADVLREYYSELMTI